MKYSLQGLHCTSCAAKIEKEINQIEALKDVKINMAAMSIHIEPQYEETVQEIADRIEPGVRLIAADTGKRSVLKTEETVNRNPLIRILAAGGLFAAAIIAGNSIHNIYYVYIDEILYLLAYLLVGYPVLIQVFRNIKRGQVFDETFLMTIATVGAIAVNAMGEAVGVMLFYAIGEMFQDMAVTRSRHSISELMDVRPDYANLWQGDHSVQVDPFQVVPGQVIEIKPGEKVPLDGVVIEGSSFIDTAALTGESLPRRAEPGMEILGGVINGSGLLKVEVTREFSESSVSKILELVENAANRKAPTEQFITRFAGWYTPLVVGAAVLAAVIPPLFIPGAGWSEWTYRALILLVISCPCALVVSIPLGYFGGIGGASRAGILVKGANYLDELQQLKAAVFDKTGTLTQGVFRVTAVQARNGFSEDQILAWAAQAEVHSVHPIARSIREAFPDSLDITGIEAYEEIEGHGIKARINGNDLLAGNKRLLQREGIYENEGDVPGTVVYVAVNGTYTGYLVISDEIKPGAAQALKELRRQGVEQIIMLTGDDREIAARVGAELGVDRVFAELLPQEKVERLEKIKTELQAGSRLSFVGDGINDAPVLMRADFGIAMGALGSDAAIEAADVVLMDDHPAKLAQAVKIARATRKIVIQNIVLALGIKGLFVALGVGGMATMWEAVFADVGVALLAVLNSTRTLRIVKYSSGG